MFKLWCEWGISFVFEGNTRGMVFYQRIDNDDGNNQIRGFPTENGQYLLINIENERDNLIVLVELSLKYVQLNDFQLLPRYNV